jgi:hypothetical protein
VRKAEGSREKLGRKRFSEWSLKDGEEIKDQRRNDSKR